MMMVFIFTLYEDCGFCFRFNHFPPCDPKVLLGRWFRMRTPTWIQIFPTKISLQAGVKGVEETRDSLSKPTRTPDDDFSPHASPERAFLHGHHPQCPLLLHQILCIKRIKQNIPYLFIITVNKSYCIHFTHFLFAWIFRVFLPRKPCHCQKRHVT